MDHQDQPPLEISIKQQMTINRSKNLLYIGAEHIMDIDPCFLAALEKLLDSPEMDRQENISPGMITFAVQALLKRLYSVNQYVQVSDQKIEELKEIYRQTWRVMVKTRQVRTALREQHYPALSQWLATLYPKEFQVQLKFSPQVGHVVNEEYSAQFQIALLRINIPALKQPVLDIGCGSQANLARTLRSEGIEVFGFDRFLEVHEPYLEQNDWFEYPFRRGVWGTIISNMAFTNHLNYAYLHDILQLEPYLLKMKDILESLAIGGSFLYAPALPFVEERLAPECYHVVSEPTAGEIFVSTITRIA
jgi:SAM-dependent methyltransferase